MKISKKAEYALRAITAMGRAPLGTTFSIHEVATKERIPVKFLEQILLALKNGGLLRSKRGVGGGYQLTRGPEKISLGEIIEMIDGPFAPIACASYASHPRRACECGISGGCGLGKTVAELRETVHAWLYGTMITKVIENERQREAVSFDI
jgi:Rrf2 family protein